MRNILVTLVENISDKNGKVVSLRDLDNNSRYYFQIRKENGIVIIYPFFKVSSEGINKEIQSKGELGICGKNFVAPIKRRKIKWLG